MKKYSIVYSEQAMNDVDDLFYKNRMSFTNYSKKVYEWNI